MHFGMKKLKRNIKRWERSLEMISVGQISGAVGTYQHIDPEIEILVCEKLGLEAETVSNQVIQEIDMLIICLTYRSLVLQLKK